MVTDHKAHADHKAHVEQAKHPTETVHAADDRARKSTADVKKNQQEAEKLHAEHGKLAMQAAEDRAKAEHVKLTPEQVKANESAQKADDALAKAAEADRKAAGGLGYEATIQDANVLGYGKNPDLHAGHHLAQKFGNDPANPRPRGGHPEVTDEGMVRLQRTTPDSATPVYTSCHPDLVGDYMRAGWNRADSDPAVSPGFAAPRETASDGTTQVDDRTAEVIADDSAKRSEGQKMAAAR